VKLVLKRNKYFVESRHSDVLQKLLKDKVIQECLMESGEGMTKAQTVNAEEKSQIEFPIAKIGTEKEKNSAEEGRNDEKEIPEDIDKFYEKLTGDDEEDAEAMRNLEVLAFESKIQKIKYFKFDI